MPSIELKSIDRLSSYDRILENAGAFAKAGRLIDEKTIQMFARHKINFVPTVKLTYEEKDVVGNDPKDIDNYFQNFIRNRESGLEDIRNRLFEKLQSIYVPFSEKDSVFCERGKKKQITEGILLERNPEILYQPDIQAGSESIIRDNDIRFLREMLSKLFEYFNGFYARIEENLEKKNILPKVGFHSVRLQSHYEKDRLSTMGNAVAWHAVDTVSYFMAALINLNKKRNIEGKPLSDTRFDPDSKVEITDEVQYGQDLIVEAGLGILLHAIGYSHRKIHHILSIRPLLSSENPKDKNAIKTLQRHIYVSKNLMGDRSDISSIARMMVNRQKLYPDGTGFPPLNENRFIHEFVRMFQIVDFYDGMTNPIIEKVPYNRMDVIQYMRENAGEYTYSKEHFVQCKRFDSNLLEEFLDVLSPYEIGEKLYLYPKNSRNSPLFIARVVTYKKSHIPLLAVLKDERTNKSYKFGSLLIHIPSGMAFTRKSGGKIMKKKLDWINNLEIFDHNINPGNINEFYDVLYGNERKLSRKVKQG